MTDAATTPHLADERQSGSGNWQRLSPRMLLVHPVHELLRQLPVLIGSVVLGSATGNSAWPLAALGLTMGFGLLRWFFTTYRIDDDNVELRTGVLQRRQVSVPRNRIRSVQTDARLLHRLLRLTVLRVGTGQETHADSAFELDALEADQVPALRALLLAEPQSPTGAESPPGRVLARWRPSWLRYAPLSFSGLVMIGAAIGLGFQSGLAMRLQESGVTQAGVEAARRSGVIVVVAVAGGLLVVTSVVLAVLFSWLTYGNLVLRRDPPADSGSAGVLHLRHGLLRVREHTFDMARFRGGTLREPLLVRGLRGARLDAIMTGVHGEGESSVLLPPCPSGTAAAVLADLMDTSDAPAPPLRRHGPAATRRRWTRAMALPAVTAVLLLATAPATTVPGWAWVAWAVVTAGCAGLAADRARSLGHRVDGGWLVSRAGSLERRRDCLSCPGIVAWTVRQTLFQRRAGVATLIAATAAGRKHYRVLDIPADLAWSVAATASPWVADSIWARNGG